MFDIFLVVLPVFLVVGCGYLSVRFDLFAPEYADGLMNFTQNFAIPCLLFGAIARLDLSVAFDPSVLGAYYIGSVTSFTLGCLGAYFLFRQRPGESVAIGFCALFANSILLGLPIVERAFGAENLGPITAIISIHAPFCYFLGITTMELVRADGRSLGATAGVVLRAIFSNALMIGLMLGFFVNLTRLPLPTELWAATDMIARAALPAALFGLGGVLVRYGLNENRGEIAMIVGLKLIVHPLVALTMAQFVFRLPLEVTSVIVLTAAMSPGVNTYVFANRYNRAKGTAASGVLVGTLLAVVSVTIWLSILRSL